MEVVVVVALVLVALVNRMARPKDLILSAESLHEHKTNMSLPI
jgi:hypothetical protein